MSQRLAGQLQICSRLDFCKNLGILMVGADANQGCIKSPHLVPEGCHRQQEPFLVKGKPRCARLSFHKRKGFYILHVIIVAKKVHQKYRNHLGLNLTPHGWRTISHCKVSPDVYILPYILLLKIYYIK